MWPTFVNLYKTLRRKYRLSGVMKRNAIEPDSVLSAKMVIFGPWLGEVGPELQYWIPFIRQLKKDFFRHKKTVVISRGAVQSWYGDFADNYLELFNHLTLEQYRELREKVVKTTGLEKQLYESSAEKQIIKSICLKKEFPDAYIIYPSMMWQVVWPWSEGKISLENLVSQLTFEKIKPDVNIGRFVDELGLPEKFAVMKFYASSLFPKNKANSLFIRNLLAKLVKRSAVVVLNNKSVDNHPVFDISAGKRITILERNFPVESNLGIQTEIIRRSSCFYGTNGGFNVIPALVGRPAVAFFSTPLSKFMPAYSQHEMIARRIFDNFGSNNYTVLSTDAWLNIVF